MFATSISCIDGRIQSPIADWIKKTYKVDYVDTITEPGLDKRILEQNIAEEIRRKANISLKAHKSNLIVISGHAECAGNPVSDEEHKRQIAQGTKIIKSWNYNVDVVGVWVDQDWRVNLVS